MKARDGTGRVGHTMPKHVWVAPAGGGRQPGLLLDWRQVAGGWEAYVVWGDGGGNVKARVYMEWLPADHVTPTSVGRGPAGPK